MSVKGSWCSNLNRWDLFFIEPFGCCMMKKSWAFSDLVAAISPPLHEFFVHSKYANSVFVIFIKILFDNWRRFRRPSVIFVPVKCPQDGGIWSPEWTLVWGIWTAFWARVGGNLNNNFQKSQMPGGLLGGGMLKLRFDRYIILMVMSFAPAKSARMPDTVFTLV